MFAHSAGGLGQNYENMFYSYSFPTGKRPAVPFEPRFVAGELNNPVTTNKEHWLGMNLNSMYDGAGMQQHGRPDINLVIGRFLLLQCLCSVWSLSHELIAWLF